MQDILFKITQMMNNIRRVFNVTFQNILINKTRNLRSVVPRVEIPNLNLEEYVWQNWNEWHDKTALVCVETDRSYTYEEVYRKSNALANFLYKFSQKKFVDTAAIVLPNIPEYPIILLGAIQAGLKITSINPFSTPDEIGKLLLFSESKLIFTSNEVYDVIHQTLLQNKLEIPTVIVKTKENTSLPNDTIHFDDVTQGPYNLQFKVERNQNDTIIKPFSSGTTGFPKGVELSHKNVVSSLHEMSLPEFGLLTKTIGSDRDVIPVMLPMYHLYGMVIILLQGLLKGSKLITIPKFTSQILVKILEKEKSVICFAVPPIFHMLLNNNNFTKSHLRKIKTILCGGAPIGAQSVMKLDEKASLKIKFIQGYGLTECSSLTHIQTPFMQNGIKSGGVGFLLPSLEGKIVSIDSGKTLDQNQAGEILMRGPQVMKGYYKNKKATEEVITEDNWLKTGDVGYYDEDGHFFITDRIKELIKVKGFQVSPAELEELLREHPEIDDIAVIGVPHDKFGEVAKALVVKKRSSTITSEQVQDYVKKKVVHYKQLFGGVSFVNSIPKSDSGKILRRQLKSL